MDIGTVNLQAAAMVSAAGGRAKGTPDAEAPAKETGKLEATLAVRQTESEEREPVEAAASNLREFAQTIRRNLNFDVDDSSGRVVVLVTDSESGEVIRQIPSEDALKLAESLSEIRSLLFKAEA
ncbi:flagellar protein FlaG [Metapseudomonas furukawaii]|uniref:flagellar protein FlaG n=1 Tax=Metapseudomonas furukawaii TaxID=1149133 RepID=UPI00227BEA46|nr:flagellar protein FlaG [Pseudomonas furukawaii]WAG77616.1 flagellar protein FlaG [Pseudomonas furukawaii]